MTKKPFINIQSANADALFAHLSDAVDMSREAAPALIAPEKPEHYAEVKSGLHSIAEHAIDPARAQERRTDSTDVARELVSLLADAARRGFRFDALAPALEYDEAHKRYRSTMDVYARNSDARAQRAVKAVQDWTDDLLAVLQVCKALGIEEVVEAQAADNKLLASTALRFIAEERGSVSVASALPIVAAGRGLMVLRSAGIQADKLTQSDLEALVTRAALDIMPEPMPGYGLNISTLRFRVGTSKITAGPRAVILYREAQTQGGRLVLPHSVLAAASKAIAGEETAKIASRLAQTPHQFNDGGYASSSLAKSNRRVYGAGLNGYADTLS
ncbi:conserved protein of unknown function [Ectopseudomonas oleovorans]|uniref:Uncharacterized protein n=1 Tax=Ectopseudomonas oleovorans TaxID=301 RepID=A0A653BA45_ECTOL|nr:conserved protein of unknown function [Pseudomonas oleovorans]